MSLKKNIIANYVSHIYVSALAIVVLPFYLRIIGAEAYGLVGFFNLMTSWFALLDMGLCATMGRETARFRGGATSGSTLRQLLRTLEWLFLAVALLGVSGLILSSDYLSHHWLKVQQLSFAEVSLSIQVMAIIAALRWMLGLFRGVINGFERQVWLSTYNAVFSTLRFIGVIPVLLYWGSTPVVFFSYQLIIAVIELVVLVVKTYVLLPSLEQPLPLRFDVKPLLPILRFSASISFLSVVWVLVTQTDKVILSKLLDLSQYGLFTMAATAASGMMMFSSPISSAVQPRFARLHAEGNEAELIALYRKATQFVSVMVFPVAMILVFFAKQVLWIWTNDPGVADKIAMVFGLYVFGNALLTIVAFTYYLQFAKGDMRLHLYGNILFLVVQVPSTVLATVKYGMIGAGCAWLIARAIFLLLWVPVVHRKFARGIHLKWLGHDVGYPLLSSMAAALALSLVIPDTADRTSMAALIGLSGLLVLSVAVLSSGESRRWAVVAARELGLFGRKGSE